MKPQLISPGQHTLLLPLRLTEVFLGPRDLEAPLNLILLANKDQRNDGWDNDNYRSPYQTPHKVSE